MRRGFRLLAPVISATATLALAGLAHAAQDAQGAGAAEETQSAAPEAITFAGTEVAGSQVEGEASVSTESISASGPATSEGRKT